MSTLIRWSGMALAIGGFSLGVLFPVTLYPLPLDEAKAALNGSYVLAHTFHYLGALLVLFGLVGWYVTIREKAGRFALIAFIIAFVATSFHLGGGMISTFINPILAATNPGFFDHSGAPPPGLAGFVAVYGLAGIVLTFVLLFVGYILFGIATVRAGVLPRWAAWLVTIGAALRYVPIPADSDFLNLVNTIGGVLFGIGLFALGWAIWSGKRQGMMAQTQPAST